MGIVNEDMAQITEHGKLPNICDDNENPIRIAGRDNLQVKLGAYRFSLYINFCDLLGAPSVLGADFCGRFVLDIRPKDRLVEGDDGSTMPIARNPKIPHPTRPVTAWDDEDTLRQ